MEIKISKSARICTQCEREFVHEEELSSAVRIVEEQLQREDYCLACWKDVGRENIYSYWTPRFYDARVADQEPEEAFSPLRKLFYDAAESEVRADRAKAFLAAQLLRRQKVFRLIKESDASDGDTHVYLYTDRIGNRLVEVRDPQFTYGELDVARHELVKYLQESEAAEAAQPSAQQEEQTHGTIQQNA